MTGRSLYDQVQAAAGYLREQGAAPKSLVVLGTGLGGFADRFDDQETVAYADVPHFPTSTAPGHDGELVLAGDVMVMAGRFHYYEGYAMDRLTLPIRVARALGADTLLITSAVGGMNPQYRLGEIVAIEDHIHLMGDSPLRGAQRRSPRSALPRHERAVRRRDCSPSRRGHLDATGGTASSACGTDVGGRPATRDARRVPLPPTDRRARTSWACRPRRKSIVAVARRACSTCALSVVTDLCFPDALEPVRCRLGSSPPRTAAAPRLEELLLGTAGAHARKKLKSQRWQAAAARTILNLQDQIERRSAGRRDRARGRRTASARRSSGPAGPGVEPSRLFAWEKGMSRADVGRQRSGP